MNEEHTTIYVKATKSFVCPEEDCNYELSAETWERISDGVPDALHNGSTSSINITSVEIENE